MHNLNVIPLLFFQNLKFSDIGPLTSPNLKPIAFEETIQMKA